MFALQLLFRDGVSKPELLYVGQSDLLVSGDSSADLVIEDLKRTRHSVQILKRVGRAFKIQRRGSAGEILESIDCDFTGKIDLDFAVLTVVALDADLRAHGYASFEKAGIQAFQEAISLVTLPFPAIVVKGKQEFQVSLGSLSQVFIGRAAGCELRLTTPEISGKHARVGLENGFIWVEDLGSTNGTFVAGRQISGRVNLDYAAPIVLGRDVSVGIVRNADEFEKFMKQEGAAVVTDSAEVRYPVVCAYSPVARPGRLELAVGSHFTVGRDPNCDLWLGAPHVSRRHCEISCEPDGSIVFLDRSTNGTAYSRGILKGGERLALKGDPEIFNFGNDLTLAICFNADQERIYRASKGSFAAFAIGGQVDLLGVSDPTMGDDDTADSERPEIEDSKLIQDTQSRFGSVSNAEISFKNPRQIASLALIGALTIAVVVAVAGVVVSFFR